MILANRPLRPRAKGLLQNSFQSRQELPIVGGFGLSPEQKSQAQQAWLPYSAIFEPGLRVDAFANALYDDEINDFESWREILNRDQLQHVQGAFAMAEIKQEQLLLIRDSVGERTLFYAPIGNACLFASTLDLVLKPNLIARQLNLEALMRYLSYAYVPGRETLLQGIYELEPGERVVFQNGKIQHENWWHLPDVLDIAQVSEHELQAQLRCLLEQAVSRRLPASETICASLSGGLDSSLVVGLLRQLHSGQIKTFSVSFGKKYRNELPFSQFVADQCQTDHQVLEVHPKTMMYFLDETIALMGNPVGDPLTVPNTLIFREASQYSSVLFNGEGGDPNFGGPKNIPMILSQIYGNSLYFENPEQPFLREKNYLYSYRKLYEDLPQFIEASHWQSLPDFALERQLSDWLGPQAGDGFVQKLMAINTRFKGAHHILFKVNALSQAFGVYPASPLFDSHVTNLALQIPAQLKLKGTVEKYILKQAVADLVPERILLRPKSGMQVPIELWLKPGGPLHRQGKKRLKALEDYPWFNAAYLRQLSRWELPGFLPRHGAKAWILLTLEAWLRHYLP